MMFIRQSLILLAVELARTISVEEEDERFVPLEEGEVLHFPSAFNASLATPTEWQLVTTTLSFSPHESECFREGVKRMVLGEFCRAGVTRQRRRISWSGVKTAMGIGVNRAAGRASDVPGSAVLWAVRGGGARTWNLLKTGWSNKWNVISWTANTVLDAYSWYTLRNSINQLQEDMSKGMNSSKNSLSALDESILCDRQIQLERTKWTLLASGGYLIPELSSVRFDKKFVDTIRAKVLSCSAEDGKLSVTMAEAKMVRQPGDSVQLYDEITTAMRMEEGNGSMLVSTRKNYFIEPDGSKTYVKDCVPDLSGHTVLCERQRDSDAVPQFLVSIAPPDRILWMQEVKDAMIVVTNAKTLTYTRVDGTETQEEVAKPNLLIRCKAGESFTFGHDKVKCTSRQRRDLTVKSQEVLATGARPHIANLSSLVVQLEAQVEENKEGMFAIFGSIFNNVSEFFDSFWHVIVALTIAIVLVVVVVLRVHARIFCGSMTRFRR